MFHNVVSYTTIYGLSIKYEPEMIFECEMSEWRLVQLALASSEWQDIVDNNCLVVIETSFVIVAFFVTVSIVSL